MKKKDKKKIKNKGEEEMKKELNIRYHDVNPEWNYTISPRTNLKQVKNDEK